MAINPRFSDFAVRFAGPTGARQLMDDLGEVLSSGKDLCNLGGGNPAQIPAIESIFHEIISKAVHNGAFHDLVSRYDGPQGHRPFLIALSDLLNREYGWGVGPDNIAMTTGSQSSFFIIFNLLAGLCGDGKRRHIQLPMVPEYIGYADIAMASNALRTNKPIIERIDSHSFKYHIDFNAFEVDDMTGGVCVSRPTNPTGNVISTEEMERLMMLTQTAGVPLIIDNAYGVPFPNIVFSDIRPMFDSHVIYCMSLSKLGLPGLRTGIVVANEEVIEAIRSINAVMSLATGSLGASLATPLVQSSDVLRLGNEVIRPYYEDRLKHALSCCKKHLSGLDYFIHQPEGAIFLWLWFPELPITAQDLYQRLKTRGVLIIPGHYFFPGFGEPWKHVHECVRISYSQSSEQVEKGIRVLSEEIRRAFSQV